MTHVWVEVTYRMKVPITAAGPDQPELDASPTLARAAVAEDIATRSWGGYSMLGKAFVKAGLHPWDAVSVTVVDGPLPTQGELLNGEWIA